MTVIEQLMMILISLIVTMCKTTLGEEDRQLERTVNRG